MARFDMEGFGTVAAFRAAQDPRFAGLIASRALGTSDGDMPVRRASVLGREPAGNEFTYRQVGEDGPIVAYVGGRIAGSAGRDLHNTPLPGVTEGYGR